MARQLSISQRLRALEKEIRRHQNLYYVKNEPEISDRDFDRLFTELQTLENEHPEKASPDSPTRSVGSDLDNEFQKYTHTIPVLSLGNTYSTEEALQWARKQVGDKKSKLVVQWKIDGATLVLYYERGKLVRAVTRGSGQVGDVVTNNALTIKNIPHQLSAPVDLTARGEVHMTYEDFEAFNERFGLIYANPRNLSAGSLKHKKSRDVAMRPLRWVAFEGHFTGQNTKQAKIKTDEGRLKEMERLGLPVSRDSAFVQADQLEKTIAEFESKRRSMPMPVDGLVLKIDDLALRDQLGFTANSPRWATALKFEPDTADTKVVDIEVFVGRTGRVTPRAELEPVRLAGTTVTYATLHNADFIERLGVRVGSTVRVSKRGEIIPAVEEVLNQGKGRRFTFPKKCPVCKTKLERAEGAADWMCNNPMCPEKMLNAIIFFCQRKQMDIAGMGEKVCRILFERGLIQTLPDIYKLPERRSEIEALDGFGKKSVDLLTEGIEKSKDRPFRYVLPALGLREVGHSITGILLESGYRDIDAILALASSDNAEETLSDIDGIGPRTAEAIIQQFNHPDVRKLIEGLRKAGLKLAAEKEEAEQASGPGGDRFAGQTWCVTGSFANFQPRDLAIEEITKRGGKTTSTVSGKTTHLLAGEKAGSKLQKAERLGIRIVSEGDFMKMIS